MPILNCSNLPRHPQTRTETCRDSKSLAGERRGEDKASLACVFVSACHLRFSYTIFFSHSPFFPFSFLILARQPTSFKLYMFGRCRKHKAGAGENWGRARGRMRSTSRRCSSEAYHSLEEIEQVPSGTVGPWAGGREHEKLGTTSTFSFSFGSHFLCGGCFGASHDGLRLPT